MTPPAGPPSPAAHAEMLRQSERVVDDQVRTFERADAKSERLVALGLAVMGVGLALAAQAAEVGGTRYDLVFMGFLGLGLGSTAMAVRSFLGASLGMFHHSEVRVGPSPDRVARDFTSRARPLEEIQGSALMILAECYLENAAKLEEALERRVVGARRLVAGAACLAAAMLYISGR